MRECRVRFAPSPTGPLHIGGLRTALFNYLFARSKGGKFLLRIEDTDRTRFVPGAEDYIKESLAWCGIQIDEGPDQGGDFGPYRQSERKAIYKKYAWQLVEGGNAYIAFDSPESLEKRRTEAEAEKRVFTYDLHTRMQMDNSLVIGEEQARARMEKGAPYVIRFRFPENTEIVMEDLVRGEVKVNTNALDDKILFKSDGMPTYHLANVVDDYEMQISHVIRGEEWLPSLPLHVGLYTAFGWGQEMPQFAHLPLILKPNGKGKLSKRDGDKGGFPVFPLEWTDPKSGEVSSGYREAGYFPEACVNILAFLGWNPGTEKELYTMPELIGDFDISRVGKAGAKFDPEKARWFNHQYLQLADIHHLSERFKEINSDKQIEMNSGALEEILELVRERASFPEELWDHSYFFFEAPKSYDEKVVNKRWKEQTAAQMKRLAEVIEGLEVFRAVEIEQQVKAAIAENEWGMGAVMNAWRLLMVGTAAGPSLFEMAAILGKEEVLARIEHGISALA